LKPIPSEPGIPAIACQMTDADVVARVANTFGTTVSPSTRFQHHRRAYATRVRGSRAAALMQELATAMGQRRRAAIAAALHGYSAPIRKLDYAAAEEMRDLYTFGESVSWLSRAFGVARSTVRQVLAESIYVPAPETQSRHAPGPRQCVGPISIPDVSSAELWWLAGWLEGEGSFLAPPPSDPRRVRISGVTRDADVASEVARLLRVSPLLLHTARERRLGRRPLWRLLRRGSHAVAWMNALHPLMGARRQAQIESALAALD
jgi:hypothetical protein